MKSEKKITSSIVGIIFAIIGIIASILVIIINVFNEESVGVGIGLLCFSILALFTNIKNENDDK